MEGIISNMGSGLSVDPSRVSSAAAELDRLAGIYTSVLNVSEQTVARASLITLGQQALGLQIAHANFLKASINAQSLLVQAKEMLHTTAKHYQAQDAVNTAKMIASI